ncbi:MAG: response regulator [Pseudomonadota bacterium]
MLTSFSKSPLDSLRLLVVDDHPINREFLRAGLGTFGARIEAVASGAEAIDRCREREYDLILMDLHMPIMDGLETAIAIQALGTRQSEYEFVFLTADTRAEEHDRVRKAGFLRILNKPIELDELGRELVRYLGLDSKPHAIRQQRAGNPLVDQAAALETCNDQIELVTRMKLRLADELDERLGDVEQLMIEGRHTTLRALLHQWIGAAGFAGARNLALRCQSLMAALEADSPDRLAEDWVDFMRSAQATRAALRQ